MSIGLGFKGGVLGIGEEVVYGTAVTRTKFLELNSDGLDVDEERLESGALPNIFSDDDEVARAAVNPNGSIDFEMRYEGQELLLKHAMGRVDTVEVASFTVTLNTNDMLDFKEDAGAELHATLTPATYKMGERGHYEIDATNNKIDFKEDAGAELTATLASAEYATATLLAAQIKTQLEAAGLGTYTITYSATTNKFTIAVSGAVSKVQFLWKTGTNGADGNDVAPHAELGFIDTKDTSNAVSIESDYSTFDPDGSLCKEIKTQLESAGAATYTITFSNSTKKITITKDSGTIQFLWKTGVSGSDNADEHAGDLLGFDDDADGSAVISDTGDNVIATVFDHTFKLTDELPTGLTLEVDKDIKSFVFEGCKLSGLTLSIDNAGFLIGSVDVIGEDVNAASVTSATLSTKALINFANGAIADDVGTINVPTAEFSLSNNLKEDRRFIGSRLRSEPKRNGKIEVTGSYSVEYEDETNYDDFRAMTSKSLTLTFTGATAIKVGFNYTMTITHAKTKLTKGLPLPGDPGIILYDLTFKSYAQDSDTREFNIVMRNTLSQITA